VEQHEREVVSDAVMEFIRDTFTILFRNLLEILHRSFALRHEIRLSCGHQAERNSHQKGDGGDAAEPEKASFRSSMEAGGGRSTDNPSLSDREIEIIKLIATGLSNAEIADELHYAEGTVKADIRHINQLWGVENRLQIVLRATELGLIDL
jgi:ATP/maltotriose-dependent transcriptional regulator MalT